MEKRLPLPTGTVLQGRYRIMRQLGHGGFGAVYEAIDDEIGKSFALKETFYAADEELRQAFKREARMLASLEHDAFPNVSHYFTEGDGCFLVMELIRGDDLDKLLSQRAAPFEQEQVLTWAEQILDALEDLHSGGIIHRDIKPSNLKLTPKGRIKLLDFGIAKGALEGDTTLLTTVGSLAAATVQYAPLEQVLRASEHYQAMLAVGFPDKVSEILQRGTDARSDLYALGATLYQLLTKALPADSPTRALAFWSGQKDRLIPAHEVNAQVSQAVSDVLQKAMKIDRRERPASAVEMRRMLKEAVKPVAIPELAPIVNSFVELDIKPIPQPFKVEPIKSVPKNEVSPLPDLPKPSDKPKNKMALYAALIVLSVLLVIIGFTYFNQFESGVQTDRTNKPAVNAKYELAQTLTGHRDAVISVAFSPDGKTIASGSSDDTIKLWDAAGGNLKQTLIGHSGSVNSIEFSPDGKTIASASGMDDETIKLWDAVSGNLIRTLAGHSSWVSSAAFSPDGKTIASGSEDKTIKLWDAISGNLKQTLIGHSSYVSSVMFSPDGKTIVSGSDDKTIKVWDAASGNLIRTLTGHSNAMKAVFSPDGKMIVSGSLDNTIKLWDAASGSLIRTLAGHGSWVHSVAFSPDGKTIVSGSKDKKIKLWDAASGNLKQTLTGHGEPVIEVTFSPDGKTIASTSWDGTIKLWRAE